MAESDNAKSLSEHYLLKDGEGKPDMGTKSVDTSTEKDTVNAAPEASITVNPVEASVTTAVGESAPESIESSRGSDAATEENVVATDNSDKDVTDVTGPPPTTSEESSENADQENTDDETSGIKLETAPGDYRFPTTNQSRHCFTRYVEYHRCVATKGEGAPECDKFAKYYRSLCPGEWVDRWNEQRENGTFPGPL